MFDMLLKQVDVKTELFEYEREKLVSVSEDGDGVAGQTGIQAETQVG